MDTLARSFSATCALQRTPGRNSTLMNQSRGGGVAVAIRLSIVVTCAIKIGLAASESLPGAAAGTAARDPESFSRTKS